MTIRNLTHNELVEMLKNDDNNECRLVYDEPRNLRPLTLNPPYIPEGEEIKTMKDYGKYVQIVDHAQEFDLRNP